MNKMQRITINLLGAGLLLGAMAARAEEKPAAAASGDADPMTAHWSTLRDSFRPSEDLVKKYKERHDRRFAELVKRQGEIYKLINEGKVEEAFPTVFDIWVLADFLTPYVDFAQGAPYLEARFKEALGEAGMEQRAAERRRVEAAIEKYRQEDRQEYESALKAASESNPEWAAAERRIKEVTAKLETLGVNEKGQPKDRSRKLTPEETVAAAAAAKEYTEAQGVVRPFRDVLSKKDPENARLQKAAEAGNHSWMMFPHGPFDAQGIGGLRKERFDLKKRVGNGILGTGGKDWKSPPDPSPDPALPRVDHSGSKPGTAKTLDLGNGVKLELVWIPPGEFMMGSALGELGRLFSEKPHRVKLTKGFWMGKYEVTQEQWQRVLGNNPSWFTNAGPKAPVETVRFDQAQKFIRKLGELAAGKAGGAAGKFRLPTEAEWEWACRAGTDKALYNGKVAIKGANNGPELDAIAWYGGNSGVEYEGGSLSAHWPDKQQEHRFAGTHPVGQKKPNAWGLYDMLGNVWEWCEDMHYAYPSRAVTDPMEQAKDKESFGGTLRGGAWNSYVRLCRSASRDWTYYPEMWRNAMIGFRVAMDEPPAAEKK